MESNPNLFVAKYDESLECHYSGVRWIIKKFDAFRLASKQKFDSRLEQGNRKDGSGSRVKEISDLNTDGRGYHIIIIA